MSRRRSVKVMDDDVMGKWRGLDTEEVEEEGHW